jgi:hypothetical protein
MVVIREDGSSPMLAEVDAHDEAQLQERLKAHADLLPVDEFDLVGPLMVVGRETTLPSGAAVCLAPSVNPLDYRERARTTKLHALRVLHGESILRPLADEAALDRANPQEPFVYRGSI